MIKFLAKVFSLCMNIIYLFFKLLKTEDKVSFISRQSNSPSLDFQYLINEIKENHPQCRVEVLCKMIPKSFSGRVMYCFEMLRQMKLLSTSKVVIIDGYCVLACMLHHKKSLTIVQMWHALGAVKKFGLQSLGAKEGRNETISKAMKMHKNYDYVISPSKETSKFYMQAFDIPQDKIQIYPLPRVDYILDGNNRKSEFYSLNPDMKDKKVVLYLPTFRSGESQATQQMKTVFKNQSDYQLLISNHPLSKVQSDQCFLPKGDFSSFDLMKIADIIVTDYSACAFEASLLMKPLYFFIPDYEDYIKNRGINVDVKKEFVSSAFEDVSKLFEAIKKNDYDMDSLSAFKEKYIENVETNNTARLADFILQQM